MSTLLLVTSVVNRGAACAGSLTMRVRTSLIAPSKPMRTLVAPYVHEQIAAARAGRIAPTSFVLHTGTSHGIGDHHAPRALGDIDAAVAGGHADAGDHLGR